MSKNKNELAASPVDDAKALAQVGDAADVAPFATTGLDLLGGDSLPPEGAVVAGAEADAVEIVYIPLVRRDDALILPADPTEPAPAAPAVDPLIAIREELLGVEQAIALAGDPHALLKGLEQRRSQMIADHAANEEAYQVAMGELMSAREKAMNARQWVLEDLRLLGIKRDALLAKLAT